MAVLRRTPRPPLDPARAQAAVAHLMGEWSPYLAIDLDSVRRRVGREGAFDLEDLVGTVIEPNGHTDEGVAVVHIRGSLRFHWHPFFDSYEAILERVENAMTGIDVVEAFKLVNPSAEAPAAEPAKAVVLCLDSPGGEAAGSIDIHRMIRSLSAKYGVPVYAYANEMACSAGYAIASSAEEIWCSDTATVGSVGVIATLFDRTSQNARQGTLIELITTGKYKGDGHADRPLTDGIRKRMQRRVNALGAVFFETVAAARGTTPEAVIGLEAGVFIGQMAVDVGLADGVERYDKFLDLVGRSVASDDESSDEDEAA